MGQLSRGQHSRDRTSKKGMKLTKRPRLAARARRAPSRTGRFAAYPRCSTDVDVPRWDWGNTVIFYLVHVIMVGLAAVSTVWASTTNGKSADEDKCWKKAHELFAFPPPHGDKKATEGKRKEPQVKSPRKIHHVNPIYPSGDIPRASCLQLWHEVLIAPSGEVAEVWVIRRGELAEPCPRYEEAISKAIRQWKYEPTLIDTIAVPVCMTVTTTVTPR